MFKQNCLIKTGAGCSGKHFIINHLIEHARYQINKLISIECDPQITKLY